MKLFYFLTIPLLFCSMFVESKLQQDVLHISTQIKDTSLTRSEIGQFLDDQGQGLILRAAFDKELPDLPQGRYFRVDEQIGIIKFVNRFVTDEHDRCLETFFLEVVSAENQDQVQYVQLDVTKNDDGNVVRYEIGRSARVWQLSDLPYNQKEIQDLQKWIKGY